MKWKKGIKKLRRRRRKSKKSEDVAEKKILLMRHNENLLFTKYREIIRRDLEQRQNVIEKCRENVENIFKEETEKRITILRKSIFANIEMTLKYIDKVELDLKKLLDRWLPAFNYDVEENTENFKNELLQRFQVYIPALNLDRFRINQEEIDEKCQIPDTSVMDRRGSTMSILQIEDLQRQLKVLQNEYEEEEIRVLAGVKVRQAELSRLNEEISTLESQMEVLSVSQLILNDIPKDFQSQNQQ